MLGILPRVQLEGRGAIPEIEIRYEEFGAKAVETIEQSLDLDQLTTLSAPLDFSLVDGGSVLEKFKLLLSNGCVFSQTKGDDKDS